MAGSSAGDGMSLDPSWPGLDAPGGQTKADPEAMTRVGWRLRQEAENLALDMSDRPAGLPDRPATGSSDGSYLADLRQGSSAGLRAATEVPEDEHWFGRWPTAGDMEYGWRVARQAILTHYHRLIDMLVVAGKLLELTAERYRFAESVSHAELASAAGWANARAGGIAGGMAAAAGGGAPAAGGPVRLSTDVPGISMCEDVHDYDPQWIIDEIDHLRARQPWLAMSDAAAALRAARDRLQDLCALVRREATVLAEQWSSPAAVECQRALRLLAGTAVRLAGHADQLGEFTARSADTVATAVSGFPDLEGRNLVEWVSDTVVIGSDPHLERKHNRVRDALARLNQAYTDLNHATLPSTIDADLPRLSNLTVLPHLDSAAPVDRPLLPSPPRVTGPSPDAGTSAGGVPAAADREAVNGSGASPAPAGSPTWTGGLASAAAAATTAPPTIPGGTGQAGGPAPVAASGGASGAMPPAGGGVPSAVIGRAGASPPASTGRGASPPPASGRGANAAGGGPPRAPAAGRAVGPAMMAGPTGASGGRSDAPRRAGATGRAVVAGLPASATGRAYDPDDPDGGSREWLEEDDDPWHGEEESPPEVVR